MSSKSSPPQILIDNTVYVPHFLSRLNNRLSSGASDLYLELFDIGINEWRVVTVLVKMPGCIAADVAEHTDIHKGVVSRSLQALMLKGLVRLETSDEALRRIFLTSAGHKLYKNVADVALAREEILLQGLTKAEVATLRSALKKMIANLPEVNAFHPAKRTRKAQG